MYNSTKSLIEHKSRMQGIPHLPKSNRVHELGLASPVGTFPYFFSARSLILVLNSSIRSGSNMLPSPPHSAAWNSDLKKSEMIWRPYPIALICGRENAVTIIKNRVQYTRGFTKRTFISPAFTSFATLANSTATREIEGNDKLTPYTKYTKHFEVSGSYSRIFWF